MKTTVTLSDTTPYYEKHFMLIDETPHAYVSAFREAQYEARDKRRQGRLAFWAATLLSTTAWIVGLIPFWVTGLIVAGTWAIVSWRSRHEAQLLARTFELALKGKEREFHEYMWRHLDRRMLRSDF
ncbi:MAG: hypothetical protein V2I57_14785 [Xanthomonadales bacterium]|jgi:hypothetical protein|nr:hypothetical protein [Xanthomonadales bacterium]